MSEEEPGRNVVLTKSDLLEKGEFCCRGLYQQKVPNQGGKLLPHRRLF